MKLSLTVLLLPLVTTTSDLPALPLVPYPQHVTLVTSSPPAVIDPRFFAFRVTGGEPTPLLFEVFDRYHRYLRLHDYIQTLNTTLKTLDVEVLEPTEELLLETSENYTLVVSSDSATLKADNVFGAMRGLETFSQLLLHNYSLPAVQITDYPRYKFRGLMIDTSRHYVSVPVIKQIITAASWTKVNIFHWHVTDDPSFPYCSPTFPDLCKKGAFSPLHVYSQTDVRNVILHAYRHGVIVLPEFDTPGHTLSWGWGLPGFLTHCPGHGNIGSEYGPINPTKDEVYAVLGELFSELAQVFPGEFLHLGGDEVRYPCWKSNADITRWMEQHNVTSYEALENYYETRLVEVVAPTKKKLIVWEELFTHQVSLAPNTVIHAWKGDWKKVFQAATAAGYDVILSNGWYISRTAYGEDWRNFYSVEPRAFNATATPEQLAHVLGGTMCMWGEHVDNANILSRTWPRASAPAERLWSPADMTDVGFMEPRIEAHRCRMVGRGYPAEPMTSRGHCKVEYQWREGR